VGKVINISSELASKGRACYSAYTAAKGAVNTLSRSLALECAPDILVNAIAPGPIETDMIMADMEPEWIEKEKDIPLRRLGKVEEIGAVAVLMASDDGNFICGQVFGVNGGAVFIQ
jgi:3-oxoacyl-[acyl-carrier protein] reductase